MRRKVIIVIVAAAAALIVVGLLYQAGYFEAQNPTQEIFRTIENLYLEPKQTQVMNHPIMQDQVVVIRIEPYLDDADTPDYELLVTMVDPSGETIINKFIKEPLYVMLRPMHPGWHAIIITNVGQTGIASGANIESRAYDEDTDRGAPFATPCIVPPSLRNDSNSPYPWC